MATKLAPGPFVNAVWRSFLADSGLEGRLLGDSFRITHATHGRVDFELDIKKHHTNRLGTLHGGTIASMVDLGGSLAVASTGRFATGVSTDLNVSYLSASGTPGSKVTGTATCEKIGKTLAYTLVQFWNEKGQLSARGSHTKYVAGTIGPTKPEFVAPKEFTEGVE
ncbi:related to PaaI_thioesterase family protein [Cephalotrichum gorgonifer]|uniref:Related to PaaI_thioesterase family protein n=1 Tax=Cephalotrichum gorgonifer TaxID=2041049 RepID=A0AAE8T0H8_9PEZI|nr:related to PaaI_thioesterase family protein [Cephalotrichum gorgonifer]